MQRRFRLRHLRLSGHPAGLQYEVVLFRRVAAQLGWAENRLNWTCWEDYDAMLGHLAAGDGEALQQPATCSMRGRFVWHAPEDACGSGLSQEEARRRMGRWQALACRPSLLCAPSLTPVHCARHPAGVCDVSPAAIGVTPLTLQAGYVFTYPTLRWGAGVLRGAL